MFGLFLAGPSNRSGGDDAPGDGQGPVCSDGNYRCNGSEYELCSGGQWGISEDCAVTCVEGLGCAECAPTAVCKDGDVHTCEANGTVGAETMACTGTNICEGGMCVDACTTAR